MALEDHARVGLLIDGIWVAGESTSIRLMTQSGSIEVVTLEGLVGFTDGAGQCSLDVAHTMKVSGTVYPYQEKCANKEHVVIQFVCGPKSLTATGKIVQHELGQSVNAATEGSYNWIGELKPMQ